MITNINTNYSLDKYKTMTSSAMPPAHPARPQLTRMACALQIALLGLIAAPAITQAAETSAPVATETLQPVVVTGQKEESDGPVHGFVARRSATGTKTDTPIVETPQSISVISADRIEAIGAVTVKDALAYTPGINAAPYGSDSRYDWVTIRGFDAYSPGFYMDGLQLRNNNGWGVWETEAYGLERIEVMRGPSSVLYGQSGPGGMVNVVTKRPTAEAIHEIEVQLGDHSRKVVAGDFAGKLDQEGQFTYRLTGLIRDGKQPLGDLPDDRVYIAPALTWKPSDNTTLTLLSHYLRTRAGASWSGYPVQGTLLPNPNGQIQANTFIGEPDFEQFNQNQWAIGYLFEHVFNDTYTVRQNARYGRFDLDYRQTSSLGFATVNADDPADPANFRLANRTTSGSTESARSFTIDNQVQGKFQSGNLMQTVLLGLDYQRSRFDTVNTSGSADPIDVYNPVYGGAVTLDNTWANAATTLAQTGLYLQDQFKYDKNWVITLAGRYDHAEIDNNDRLAGVYSEDTEHKFTGRAGVVYLAPNGLAPYLSYSTSFMPSTTINPDTGRPFSPETGRQYEAGLRYQPVGKQAMYSAAVFDLTRQNYVSYDPDFTPKQTGEIRVHGMEFEAVVTPVTGVNLTAAYTWSPKAEITKSSNPAEIGGQITPVPKHQLSVWGDYRFPFGLKLGVGLRYTGTTKGSDGVGSVDLPSYTLVDAMAGYDYEHWALALNAQNLGNKTYVTNCSGGSCYLGGLRRVIGTGTYRW